MSSEFDTRLSDAFANLAKLREKGNRLDTLLNINQEKLIKAGGEEAELLQARIKELIELISVSKEQLRAIESKDDSDEQLTTDNNLHKAEQEYQYYEQQIAKATRTNAALRKKIIVEELVRAIRNRATSDLKAEIVRKTNEKLKRVITDEQFLRYYYASVCGNRVGRTTLYDDFLKRFFPSIVELSDITDEGDATVVVDSVNEILREMRIYRKISSGEWPYEAAQPVTEWDRKRLDVLVNFLDFDIVYPLLLAATQLKQKTFAELVHMLEKFMFRYKSVCNLGHQKLSDLYMQEAVKIRNDPTAYSLGGLKTVLKRFMTTECTNEVFTAGLSNMRYRTTGSNKQLRYFFSTLNEYIEWYRDGANGKPQANTSIVINYDNVTIEHICSQSDDATQAGFTEEAKHNISNLTILTAVENNDKVRNIKYVEKQPIYVDSSYVINRYFSDVATWDQAESEKWLSYIKDAACKIFVV